MASRKTLFGMIFFSFFFGMLNYVLLFYYPTEFLHTILFFRTVLTYFIGAVESRKRDAGTNVAGKPDQGYFCEILLGKFALNYKQDYEQ